MSPSQLKFDESWLDTFSYPKILLVYDKLLSYVIFFLAKQTGNSTSAICLKNSLVPGYRDRVVDVINICGRLHNGHDQTGRNDKEINCINRGRRSCWLPTLDL